MREDKQKIAQLLGPAIQATRYGSHIEEMSYERRENGEEFVLVKYRKRLVPQRINVTDNNGITMIEKVLRLI